MIGYRQHIGYDAEDSLGRREPKAMQRTGDAARAEYDTMYAREHNYCQLMAIYEQPISESASRQ